MLLDLPLHKFRSLCKFDVQVLVESRMSCQRFYHVTYMAGDGVEENSALKRGTSAKVSRGVLDGEILVIGGQEFLLDRRHNSRVCVLRELGNSFGHSIDEKDCVGM